MIFTWLEHLQYVPHLIALVQVLSARERAIAGRLHKDSHHSSKPPSSDGLAEKPKSRRPSSGRKPRGQAGDAGTTLKHVANPEVMSSTRCLTTIRAAVRTLRHTPRSCLRRGR